MTVHDHVWWLLSRSAGIVALVAMTVSVILGLTLAGRAAGSRARTFSALHEQLSLVALGAIAVHGLTLLGDRWLHPGIAGITLPFAMGYRPLATAMGIVGGWIAAALGLSYYARRRFGPRRWRSLHRFVIVAWLLSVVHTLLAGTDATNPVLRIPLLAAAGAVAALFVNRVGARRRAGAARRPAAQRAGSGATASRP